ncbi:uncharacterized protein LOC135343306 isoform X2 [Halichondria panicea]|uniref:uncharacterized protein LOC135343306 isoform X2 n=1 Tax=Halichondria panicea TaxID=6063 RepID=UPI00312B7E1D
MYRNSVMIDWLWRCSHLLTLSLLLILQLTTPGNSMCSPTDRRWTQYLVSPLPSDFGGQSTLGDCTLNGRCLGPLFGLARDRLGDGDLGPPTLDDGTFVGHAWDQTVSIIFTLTTTDTAYVEGLNLYFYNIPSRRIGLPYNIRITSPSGDHPYQLEGNDNLTLDDNGRRSVTLIPESLSLTPTSNTFTIIFEFSDTEQIDWLLLTEVEICTSVSVVLLPNPPPINFTPDTVGTISPPTINSSFSLTCSVPEGRFDWTWTRLTGDTLPPARVLNAGRTSVLELSQLSSNDADTYRCLATHTFGTFETPVSNSVDITLLLPGTLQAENGTIQVTASDDSACSAEVLSLWLPFFNGCSFNYLAII